MDISVPKLPFPYINNKFNPFVYIIILYPYKLIKLKPTKEGRYRTAAKQGEQAVSAGTLVFDEKGFEFSIFLTLTSCILSSQI